MVAKLNLNKLLRKQVSPAIGCTEIGAVGLCVSLARYAAEGKLPIWLENENKIKPEDCNKEFFDNMEVEKIEVEVDRNVYKNSAAVGIPGADGRGIYLAAALGAYCNPENKLELFKDAPEYAISAKKLIEENKIKISVVDNWTGHADLNIKSTVKFKKGSSLYEGMARIQHRHANVTMVQKGKKVLFKAVGISDAGNAIDEELKLLSEMKLSEMIKEVRKMDEETRRFIYEGIKMNKKAAKVGIDGNLGLGLGTELDAMVKGGFLKNDFLIYAQTLTAGAADARMSGKNIPIMSSAGSGNQGITAMLPIVGIGEKLNLDKNKMEKLNSNKDKLIEAVALSHLVTSYITFYSGHLSALCGCAVKAGVGAAAGVGYLLEDDKEKSTFTVGASIDNMIGAITGVICDGAKNGCAAKLSMATETAIKSALYASRGKKIECTDGIVGKTPEESMQNIGKISKAMVPVDKAIVEIIDNK
ncbi:MAG: serine dehydratase subunit alpha family protein [Candidatus Aenigmarchaeota archaeon]|nr:serine dehydratase subunit alpha family protein [Candidatus Aenigmarchaeota archaeon]